MDPTEDPLADVFGGWESVEPESQPPPATEPTKTDDPLAELFGGWPEPESAPPATPAEEEASLLVRSGRWLDQKINKEWSGTAKSLQNATMEDAGEALGTGMLRPQQAWLMRNTGATDVDDALDNPLRSILHYQARQLAEAADPADIGAMLANEVGVGILGGGDDPGVGYGMNLASYALTGDTLEKHAKKGTAFGDAARWLYSQSGREWLEPEELMALQKENPVEAQAQLRAQSGMMSAAYEGLSDLVAMPIRVPAMAVGIAEADDPLAAAATAGASMVAQSSEFAGRVAQGNFGGQFAQDPVGSVVETLGVGGKAAKLGGAADAVRAAPNATAQGKAVAAAKAYWSKKSRAEARRAMTEATVKAEDILREAGQLESGTSLAGKVGRTLIGDPRPLVKAMNDNLTPLASAGRAEVKAFRDSNLDAASVAARLEDSVAQALADVGSKEGALKTTVRRNLRRAPEVDADLARPYIESHRLASETSSPAALKNYLDVARKTQDALEMAPMYAPKNLQRVFANASDLSRSVDFVTTLRADPKVMKYVDDVTDGKASQLSLRMSESLDPMTIGGKSAASLEGVVQMLDAVEGAGDLGKAMDLVKPNPLVAGSEAFVAQQRMFAMEVLEPLVRKGQLQPGHGLSRAEAVGHLLHGNVTAKPGAKSVDPLPSMMELAGEAANYRMTERLAESFAHADPATTAPLVKTVENFDISDRLTTMGRSERNTIQSKGTLKTMGDGTRWFQPGPRATDWGQLRGKWLNQEVAAKFAELSGMTGNSVDKVRGWISRNWVVNNPKSHVNAVAGDMLVLGANGVSNPLKSMTRWSNVMAGKGGALEAAKAKLAREAGVTAGSQLAFLDPDSVKLGQPAVERGMTFKQAMDAAKEFDFDDPKVGAIANGMTEHLYGGLGIFEAMFNAREKAYRMSLWDVEYTRLHKRKHGSDVTSPKDLDPALARKASEYALDRGFDYNLVPSGTKVRTPWRRDVGLNNALTSTVMPFMRYSQAVTMTLSRVAAETSANRFINPQLGLRATRAELALNEDNRNQRPEQRKEKSTVQVGDTEVNARSLNPIATPMTDVAAIAQAKDSLDAIPFAKVYNDIAKNRGYNGQPIVQPGDGQAEGAAKKVSYVFFQLFAPRWATSARATARKVGTTDRLGRPFNAAEEAVQKFLSINFDASKRQLNYMEAQSRRLQKDLKNVPRNAKQEPKEYIRNLKAVQKGFYSRFLEGWPG